MKTQINSLITKLYALLIIAVLFIATAKAQIVYTDINPDTTLTTAGLYTGQTYGLDLNNDGTVDFNILTVHTGYGASVYMVKVTPLNTNEVLDSFSGGNYYPAFLVYHSFIKANAVWRHTSNQILKVNSSGGLWSLNTDAYLGLKIIVGSDTCYGWARLSIQLNSTGSGTTISSTIKDYAYSAIPNQPILAGETSCTTPTVNLTQSGSLSFCAGDSVTFTANGTGYQYQWKKDGVNISGAKSQTYIAKTAGIYKCKVINSCGSKTSGTRTVTVPCRDGDASFMSMTSTELEHISVYPNPATNSVTIKVPSDEEGIVQVVNFFGQIIYYQNLEGLNQTQIDVSKFSAGMYVVRWNSGENNETKTFSIVK